MKAYILVDSSNRVTACGTSPIDNDGVKSIEVEVEDVFEVFADMHSFSYENGLLVRNVEESLIKLKEQKDLELNESCSKHISKGFTHVIGGVEYLFSFDIEAQLNFQGVRDLLNSGILPSISWTVKRDGVYERIQITKDIMNELTMVMLMHKDVNIRKYRDKLLPLLKEAKTAEEVNSITWDME